MKKKNRTGFCPLKRICSFSVIAALFFLAFSCNNSTSKTNSPESSGSLKNGETEMTIDKMPQFPGGEVAMTKFIIENVKYPQEAKKNGIQGKVFVSFLITKTGKMKNIIVKEKGNELLDNEAIRVVSSMPDWIPGEENGVAVDVEMTLPISFKLE